MGDFISAFNRLVAPMKREIRGMVRRGIIRLIAEEAKIQIAQVESFSDDVKDDVEVFQNFGLKAYAPEGSECIMLGVGGSNEHQVIIATENRESLKTLPVLDEGDSILYNSSGQYIHLKGDDIELKLKKIKIENDSDELISLISDFINAVSSAKWNTGIGPQPIFAADKAALDAIKAKVDGFKV